MTIYIYIHTYGSRIATTMKEREKLPQRKKKPTSCFEKWLYIYIYIYMDQELQQQWKEREKLPLQEKRLNTTKKFVTITTNVVAIGVIAMTKKSMQAVVINSETKGLCNTRFLLQ